MSASSSFWASSTPRHQGGGDRTDGCSASSSKVRARRREGSPAPRGRPVKLVMKELSVQWKSAGARSPMAVILNPRGGDAGSRAGSAIAQALMGRSPVERVGGGREAGKVARLEIPGRTQVRRVDDIRGREKTGTGTTAEARRGTRDEGRETRGRGRDDACAARVPISIEKMYALGSFGHRRRRRRRATIPRSALTASSCTGSDDPPSPSCPGENRHCSAAPPRRYPSAPRTTASLRSSATPRRRRRRPRPSGSGVRRRERRRGAVGLGRSVTRFPGAREGSRL